MSRKTLLAASTDEQKELNLQKDILSADSKTLKRRKRDLEDEMEDLDDKIKARLSEPTKIDSSVVETLYFQKKSKEAMLKLWSDFEEEYYTDEVATVTTK